MQAAHVRVRLASHWPAARWDLGNYYTVGGSGRVIPEDPRPEMGRPAGWVSWAATQSSQSLHMFKRNVSLPEVCNSVTVHY